MATQLETSPLPVKFKSDLRSKDTFFKCIFSTINEICDQINAFILFIFLVEMLHSVPLKLI